MTRWNGKNHTIFKYDEILIHSPVARLIKIAGPKRIGPANNIQHLLLDRVRSMALRLTVLTNEKVRVTPTSGFFCAGISPVRLFSLLDRHCQMPI